MTSNEAAQSGSESAIAWFEQNGDMLRLDRQLVLVAVRVKAVDLANTTCGMNRGAMRARDSFQLAFENVFMRRWDVAHDELPEVQAARRVRVATRWIERAIEDGNAAIEKFKSDLDKNAKYAMEWSESVFAAVAKREVALHLKEVLEHENGGVDQAIAGATRYALQGARSPKQSTSGTSNLAALYETAAFAEFVDDTRSV